MNILKLWKRHSLSDRLFQLFLFSLGVSIGALSILCLKNFSFSISIPSLPFSVLPTSNKSSTPLLQQPSFTDHHVSTDTAAMGNLGLMHNMSDDELLARAANVNNIDGVSNSNKLAFMFLTQGPLPLAPLWERFFKGHQPFYSIYVHPHPSYNYSLLPPDSVFYDRNIPSQVSI